MKIQKRCISTVVAPDLKCRGVPHDFDDVAVCIIAPIENMVAAEEKYRRPVAVFYFPRYAGNCTVA